MSSSAIAALPIKQAIPDYPILELLSTRWSPYAFADRPVAEADLNSLFEAARWAASSYNEQPWNYIVADRTDPAEHGRLLSCLAAANQTWAEAAPVLVLGVVSLQFSQNRKPNRAAVHDLGQASANLVVEATARGLSVHQMIGLLPDQAREVYQIPAHAEAWTALAIGYKAEAHGIGSGLPERDLTPRQRKPTREFVFTGAWGRSAPLTTRRFASATV